jgi:hypothetical protein
MEEDEIDRSGHPKMNVVKDKNRFNGLRKINFGTLK